MRFETPAVLQKNTSSPAKSTRKASAARPNSGTTARNLDISPASPANSAQNTSNMSEETINLADALEKLRLAVDNSIDAAESGDFAAVPERLAEGLIDQAKAMQLAIRAQRGMSSGEHAQHDELLDSTPSKKRKRTR